MECYSLEVVDVILYKNVQQVPENAEMRSILVVETENFQTAALGKICLKRPHWKFNPVGMLYVQEISDPQQTARQLTRPTSS